MNRLRTDTGFSRARIAGCMALCAVLVFVGGCGSPFSLIELVDGPDGASLSVSPNAGTVIANSTVALLATGGHPPYDYRVVDGLGSVSGNLYTAPATPGTEHLRVTDAVGSSVDVRFVVDAGGVGLGISPSSQTVYTGASITFNAIGGTGPFSYSVSGSSGAPPMAGNEYVAGTVAGTDTVTVTDLADMSTAAATVTVQAKPLSIAPQAITLRAGQTVAFAPVGGDGPFGWEVTDDQSGGSIDATGVYTAGPLAGTIDEITLTDGYDGRTRAALVTVESVEFETNVDYAPASVSNVSGTMKTNGVFTADGMVENIGTAGGSHDVVWTVYASTDTTIGGSDFIVASGVIAGGIPAGDTAPVAVNGVWPSVAGAYHLIMHVSAQDDITHGNNAAAAATAITVTDPVSIQPSSFTVYTGQTISFTATGHGPFSWLVTDPQSGGSIHPTTGEYQAGPNPGVDTIEVTDDYDGAAATATITVQSTPLPTEIDYVIDAVVLDPGETTTGSALTGTLDLRNAGSGDGAYDLSWAVYASTDTSVGGNDYVIATGTTAPIASGGTAGVPFAGFWPPVAGTYYIVASIAAVDDTNVANNFGATASATTVSETIPDPVDVDYVVETAPPGGSAVPEATFSESFVIRNAGTDAGSANLSWSVYLSDDPNYDAGDQLVDSGTIPGGLAAGVESGPIPADGEWPAATGIYYLIVRLHAVDDINPANNTSASDAYYVSAPGTVDYQVTQITIDYPAALAGSPIKEQFTIANIGSDPGTAPFGWNLYVSTSPGLGGGETLIASEWGLPALGAGSSSTVGHVPALWPAAAGSYYLIVEVADTADPPVTAVRAQGPYSIQDPPDYTVGNITIQLDDGSPGGRLDGTGAFDFSIHNQGDNGASSIVWRVYASVTPSLGPSSELLASGVHPSLAAGETSGPIGFGTAHWPLLASRYYLIITVSAEDDQNPQNDARVSGPIDVPRVYVEGPENNNGFGPTTTELTNVSDVDPALGGSLLPHELIKITGTGDTGGGFRVDTYKLTIGAGVSRIRTYAEWASGEDHIDIWVWDLYGSEWYSPDLAADREPGSGMFLVGGWSEGDTAYVGVQFLAGFGTAPYTLYIFGAP